MKMSPHIVSIRQLSIDDWLDTCLKFESVTFFHTPFWYGLFQEFIPDSEYSAFSVIFDDKSEYLVPLFFTKKLNGLFKLYNSSPAGTYGGWLGRDENELKSRILFHTFFSHKNLVVRENPFNPMHYIPRRNMPDFTQVIDLRKPLPDLYSATSEGYRRAKRKAERSGVTATVSEDIEEWKEYYNIYLNSLQRWMRDPEKKTKTVYTWKQFEKIYSMKSHRSLWLAKKEDAIISGILCFHFNHHVVYWHGAGLEDYFDVRPNNLLFWAAICDAHKNGFWWFDLNPSSGFEGVVRFKASAGAVQMQSRVYEHYHMGLKALMALKRLLNVVFLRQ